jgi:hypothetical protein
MSDITYESLTSYTAGLAGRLRRLRARIAAWFVVDGLSRVLWLALGIAAADMLLDWLFRMDRSQRLVMLLLIVGVLGWTVFRRLVRPLSARLDDDALALAVEATNKQLGQSLISAMQLAQLDDPERCGMSPALVRHTVLSGMREAQQADFGSVLDRRGFWRSAVLLVLALGGLGGLAYGITAAEPLAIWFNRNVLLGNRTWPQKTYLVIERVGDDGTVVFPRGDDWTQRVSVTADSEVVPAVVYLELRGAKNRGQLVMKRVEDRLFEATFPSVIEPFELRARGGDAVTEWVRVVLVDQPAVAELKLIVTPPKYAGGKPEELPAGRGPYYVLKGSSLAISGTANKSLARGELVVEDKRLPLTPRDSGPASKQLSAQIAANDLVAGQYTIELEDTLGLTSRRPTTFTLRTRVDREPRVRVRLIGISGMVVPKAQIPFAARIADDFGITAARIAYRWKGDDIAQPEATGSLPIGEASGQPELPIDGAIELEPLKIPTGTGLSLRFEAADNDDVSGPNIGRSPEVLLRVVTEEELRTDLLRREKEQRQEFERLLKSQEELLTDCRALEAGIKGAPAIASEQKEQLVQYQKRQKVIGQNIAAIAERMTAIVVEVQNNHLEEQGGRLQTRITKEIVEPMASVADESVSLAAAALDKARRQAAAPTDRDPALGEATRLQTEIVAKMKEILEHMVKSEGFQEAVNLLYEIQKAQTEVHDQTNKARQERIKRILEGDSAQPKQGQKGSQN